jgi:CRISPR-associated protein Cas5
MIKDIQFLFEKPDLIKDVLLTILPLAPISMVNSLPGSYYKTEHAPDKFMLCGLFENILDLHLSEGDRNTIRKKITNHYKKKYKLIYQPSNSSAGYRPILFHLFDIGQPLVIPDLKFYEDMWTQHLIGNDERHLRGVVNYDWRIENEMIRLKERNDTKERNNFFENNRDRFPRYYRSPQQREFLITKGEYIFKLKMTSTLFQLIENAVRDNNIGYLGTSEGWVNISVGEAT